jgi:hypothetical protein
MILIADDTFIDRHKFHDINYLKEEKYCRICKVIGGGVILNAGLSDLVKQLSDCKLFCHHKTLQLYNKNKNALPQEENLKLRESLINKVSENKILRIEFSRGLETNYAVRQIDKDLFYTNLKAMLDYYVENNVIEDKILFWGENFRDEEKLSIIQNLCTQIRLVKINDYANNKLIIDGLSILFPDKNGKEIIEQWKYLQISKNEIIKIINDKID